MKRPMRNDFTAGTPVDIYSMTREEYDARHDLKCGGDPNRRPDTWGPMRRRKPVEEKPATVDLAFLLAEQARRGGTS